MNLKNTLITALLLISPALQALEPATQAKIDRAKKYAFVTLYASGAVVTGAAGLWFASLEIQKALGLQKGHINHPTIETAFVHVPATVSCCAVSWYLYQKAKETLNNN